MTQSMIFYEHILIHFEHITLWSKLGRKRERERESEKERERESERGTEMRSYTINSSLKFFTRLLGYGFEGVRFGIRESE